MSVSAFNLIFVSIFLLLSVRADTCSEAFYVADITVNRLKLNFSERNFDSLPYDLFNVERVSEAIQHACSGVSISTPTPKNDNHFSCEATESIIAELLNDYSYGDINNLDKQALVLYTIEQSLSLVTDIENGSCVSEWVKKASKTSTMIDDEPEFSAQQEVEKMKQWWLDSESYINLHIGDLISNLFETIGLDN